MSQGFVMSNSRKPLPEREPVSDYEAGGKPLNGWKVLAIFVSFFLLVATVDGLMIYKAVGTFSGEVVPHPYERGLAYNRDIAQAREQAARGWKVEARVARLSKSEAEIRVTARDADGAEVTDVEMSALFAAPADLAKDVRVTLKKTTPGRYVGVAPLSAGQRDLVLTATRGGDEVFRSRNRIDVE
ncbi:MAG: nitrogen fixation protein FixH [Methylocystis sp.]|nr:MAG: nitrogen fixation protein FixH [Methylocystis sp.]